MSRFPSDGESIDKAAEHKYRRLEHSLLRRCYRIFVSAIGIGELGSQRAKSLYFAWGYWRILFVQEIPFVRRLLLVGKCLRIDWNVVHGHRPSEIAWVTRVLANRSARTGEVMIEAGCWRGGSTAKFSLICGLFGYRLHVYDSFEGVERLDEPKYSDEWKFGGQYSCAEEIVRKNVAQFGQIELCEFFAGWFSQTLANPVTHPVRLVYVDCDLAKGTLEVLRGTLPRLVSDGVVLSQDFHIAPVRKLLLSASTWQSLGSEVPHIEQRSVYMAQLNWARR